jgi:two-component system response regulator AtoC
MPHALLIDDDANLLSGLAELVGQEGFTTSTAGTLADARTQLAERAPDVVLTDLVLPDGSGLDLLRELESNPATDVVLITGHASVDSAVDALRKGVSDYLTKPIDIPRLRTVLANVARTRELKQEVGTLREELRKLGYYGRLLGASTQMQKVYDLIAKVAPTEATVLLLGESGTGKDLVAQTLHDLSRRRKKPFLPLNCGAVSPQLIESELFGHERGSFTGATQRHRGYFERAHGGTLFLDEITEMPIELQVKLLRVLETGSIIRIGGDQPVDVDVRVIAASNRRPDEAISEGKFREDLHYRLNVFPIQLPPLRDRHGDVDLLADHFLAELNKADGTAKTLSVACKDRLRTYQWPGNVRELKNLVQRAFILGENEIDVECLPPELSAEHGGANSQPALKVGTSLAETERRLILATLDHYEGDKKKAAEVLGISLKTLYNRLNLYKQH